MKDVQKEALPTGWERMTLGDIRRKSSRSITPSKSPDQQFELYSVPVFPTRSPEIVTGQSVGSSKQLVEPRTVLLCKINPRINRVWVVANHSPHVKIASTEWIPFAPLKEVMPEYLCYYMQQNELRDFLAVTASGVGGSLMRVNPQKVDPFPLLLPPLPEQHRIVAKLEELFSDLDAGVAALQRAKANLKRYRAAVLKEAVEGTLTAEWRAKNPDVEPGSVLLERILVERRRRWEAEQMAAFEAKGKTPAKGWEEKYKEPVGVDDSGLPELPEGWCWASVGQAFEVFVGATPSRSKPEYWNGDISWVSSGEVSFRTISATREKITSLGLANA